MGHGGSLSEALGLARSQARLLVAFIPASKPFQKNKKRSYDQITIEGLLSSQVAKIARRKSLKKEGMGSFVLWSTTPGSSEAVAAMKRLKAKKLMVVKKMVWVVVLFSWWHILLRLLVHPAKRNYQGSCWHSITVILHHRLSRCLRG